MNNEMQQYIENIIKTALANGLTPEQIMANPDACAKAYLEAQLKATENAGKKLLEDFLNK